MKITKPTPELLAPAGSADALDAAIAGGADAVYFGGALFNARINAKNFDGDLMREAIRKCRFYGVKSNITLNTLVHGKEMDELLRYVDRLYTFGADALIVADLGAARLIHRYFPDLELHASTQAAGHSTAAAKAFCEMGFSRMVAARELSLRDLRTLCENSPIETEMFIHGAICVSQSGGCLASSLIGGRSGNRGECAQPCRLPYRCDCKNAKDTYALSLKDICLASHVTDILKIGAASLKIEGRMKSPDYVYGVTRIYRRLLDEERNADGNELNELRALFSRSGFTDGYFTKNIDRKMLGIRTNADKSDSAAVAGAGADYSKLIKDRRRSINMALTVEAGKPASLSAELDGISVTATGAVPEAAVNRPMTRESVLKNLEKLGNTPFALKNGDIQLGDGLIMPLSAINDLRRSAVDALCEQLAAPRQSKLPDKLDPPSVPPLDLKTTASFCEYSRIPDSTGEVEAVFLPLEKFSPEMSDKVNGVIVPPVIFDSEADNIKSMLDMAYSAGIRRALVSNVGHADMVKDAGMELYGDLRLNIYNRYTAEALSELGFSSLTASPELTLPQLRDLGLSTVVYGRIPLMTLEKCVIRDLYSCDECNKQAFLRLVDRKGIRFPLVRTFDHRNILYNSVPVFTEDRQDELERYKIRAKHYIFTDETRDTAEKILNKKITAPPNGGIRRIPK